LAAVRALAAARASTLARASALARARNGSLEQHQWNIDVAIRLVRK